MAATAFAVALATALAGAGLLAVDGAGVPTSASTLPPWLFNGGGALDQFHDGQLHFAICRIDTQDLHLHRITKSDACPASTSEEPA